MGLRVYPQGDKIIIAIGKPVRLTTTSTLQLFYEASETGINLPDEDLQSLGHALINAARLLDT